MLLLLFGKTELVYIANVNTPSFHAWLLVNNNDLECTAQGVISVEQMWSIQKEEVQSKQGCGYKKGEAYKILFCSKKVYNSIIKIYYCMFSYKKKLKFIKYQQLGKLSSIRLLCVILIFHRFLGIIIIFSLHKMCGWWEIIKK
jgi:hypothetical protein